MRNAGKLLAGTVCGLTVLIFIAALFLFSPQPQQTSPLSDTPSSEEHPSSPALSAAETNTAASHYIVKSELNAICVYLEGEAFPLCTIETDVSALPQLDQKLLKAGIQLDSKEALNRLLEDLCS